MAKLTLRAQAEESLVRELARKTNLSLTLTALLVSRGLKSKEDIEGFLFGTLDDMESPYLYPDMERIVERIQIAIKNKEKILIYGDYDCDGIGAIAILSLAFSDFGVTVDTYIPVRAEDGYGLSDSSVQTVLRDYSPDLIITVDCGITSVNEIAYLKSCGVDVIVTDHHKQGEDLPDCLILNPSMHGKRLTALCGAGVALKLAHALFGADVAYRYLDICSLSTVADIVPLERDNRLIVRYGMERIRKGKCRKGISHLLSIAKVQRQKLSVGDIGFKLAPRLNASGRLQDAALSLALLLSDDESACQKIASELDTLNIERQELNAQIYREATIKLKDYDFHANKFILLCDETWEAGVIGIVAAKLTEFYHLPCILFTKQENGVFKGSGRSVSEVDLFDMLCYASSVLLHFGGHAMAAGLSIMEHNLAEFMRLANQYLDERLAGALERRVYYDAECGIDEWSSSDINNLYLFEPFGYKNPAPIFLDRNPTFQFARICASSAIKDKRKNGEVVAFQALSEYPNYLSAKNKQLLYSVVKNEFRGKTVNQFRIKQLLFAPSDFPDELEKAHYFSLFLYRREGRAKEKSGDDPTLYIALHKDSYAEFLESHSEISSANLCQNGTDRTNALVYAPGADFPFWCYHKLVLLDAVPNCYVEYLQGHCCNVVRSDTSRFIVRPLSKERCRTDYMRFRLVLQGEVKFISLYQLYLDYFENYYSDDFETFSCVFYTFMELGLLKLSKNAILTINSDKVELESSALYQHCNRDKNG